MRRHSPDDMYGEKVEDSKAASSRPRDEDEAELVRGLARRDARAISEFLERTHRPVYSMSTRLTGDPDLRHDWTHETLLKIIDEMGRGRFVYRHAGCFWAWFQKRSYFLLINAYRRNKTQQERWTAGEIGEEIVARVSLQEDVDPARLIENTEARDALESCLEKLPSKDQQRALHLMLFEELPYQAIAEEMGTPLNTVRSWIRRARTAVRKCVANRYGMELASEEIG